MTTLREAAQQALEALEGGADSWQLIGPAIDALKEALVEDAMQKFTDVSQDIEAALAEPVQEPVAWIHTDPDKRRVKPLTEEEIDGLMQSIGLRCADDGNERMANHAEWERRQRRRIARAIERAHGIGSSDVGT